MTEEDLNEVRALCATMKRDPISGTAAREIVCTLMVALDEAHAALRRARIHGVSSKGWHTFEAHKLAMWIDAGMVGEAPAIQSPNVMRWLSEFASNLDSTTP